MLQQKHDMILQQQIGLGWMCVRRSRCIVKNRGWGLGVMWDFRVRVRVGVGC